MTSYQRPLAERIARTLRSLEIKRSAEPDKARERLWTEWAEDARAILEAIDQPSAEMTHAAEGTSDPVRAWTAMVNAALAEMQPR